MLYTYGFEGDKALNSLKILKMGRSGLSAAYPR
jgi:hypothetical protein